MKKRTLGERVAEIPWFLQLHLTAILTVVATIALIGRFFRLHFSWASPYESSASLGSYDRVRLQGRESTVGGA